MSDINSMAKIVDDAARAGKAIPQLSNKFNYTLDEAYAIQSTAFQRRIARGEKQVGIKMGFTSRAKMLQLGLSELVWGRLSDQMQVEDGGEINFKKYVHRAQNRNWRFSSNDNWKGLSQLLRLWLRSRPLHQQLKL